MKEEEDFDLVEKKRQLLELYPKINSDKLHSQAVWLLTRPLKGFPETWCYEIMGNEDADYIFYSYSRFLTVHFTDKQWEQYQEECRDFPKKRDKIRHRYEQVILEGCYDNFLDYVEKKQSRLAYQVLGVYLMNNGHFLSNNLKEIILKNARWKDDEEYLKNEYDKQERKKVLEIFRDAIQNYDGIIDSRIQINPNLGPLRQPIYHLRNKPSEHNILKGQQEKVLLKKVEMLNSSKKDLNAFLAEIKNLLTSTIKGASHLDKNALEYNDYLFIFKSWRELPPEICKAYSHKVSNIGLMRNFNEVIKKKKMDPISLIMKLEKQNLRLAGSLKTILPHMVFGGEEVLFDIWMLVRTPENQIFPANLYYGVSQFCVGGWSSYLLPRSKEIDKNNGKNYQPSKMLFPSEFMELINFSPYNFNEGQLESFVEAIELGLNRIPPSDFQCKLKFSGTSFIFGLQSGKPYIEACSNRIKKN